MMARQGRTRGTAAAEVVLPPATPRLIEVLTTFACGLIEGCERRHCITPMQVKAAHEYFLEALRYLDSEDLPALHLGVLRPLVSLERKLVDAEEPPYRGVYFSLARVHGDQAIVLPEGRRLELELSAMEWVAATNWTSQGGLEAEWNDFNYMGPIDPMRGLMLLGLAAVGGLEDFIEAHLDAVCQGIAENSEASVRCEQFCHELEELNQQVDAVAQEKVIGPWMDLVERVYG